MPVKKRIAKIRAHRVTPQAGEAFRKYVDRLRDHVRARQALSEAENTVVQALGGKRPWEGPPWQDHGSPTIGSTGVTSEELRRCDGGL